jgi:hypothetical protein
MSNVIWHNYTDSCIIDLSHTHDRMTWLQRFLEELESARSVSTKSMMDARDAIADIDSISGEAVQEIIAEMIDDLRYAIEQDTKASRQPLTLCECECSFIICEVTQ